MVREFIEYDIVGDMQMIEVVIEIGDTEMIEFVIVLTDIRR